MGPTMKEFTEQPLQTPETIPQCLEPSGGQSRKASPPHKHTTPQEDPVLRREKPPLPWGSTRVPLGEGPTRKSQ